MSRLAVLEEQRRLAGIQERVHSPTDVSREDLLTQKKRINELRKSVVSIWESLEKALDACSDLASDDLDDEVGFFERGPITPEQAKKGYNVLGKMLDRMNETVGNLHSLCSQENKMNALIGEFQALQVSLNHIATARED